MLSGQSCQCKVKLQAENERNMTERNDPGTKLPKFTL